MYNNRVLIGNWYEEQNGTFVSQKYGNLDTTYKNDYRERDLPVQDHTIVWKIKENALVKVIPNTFWLFYLQWLIVGNQ